MKWRNHAAPSEIGASPREVDATPSHSLFVFSSCFTLLINKRLFFHLSTTLYPTDRLTSSASSASSRFLSPARVGLYFEASTKILGSRTEMSRLMPDGTAELVSRDQIPKHEREQGFSFSSLFS